MFRITRLTCFIYGLITLLTILPLADLRRTPFPHQWIIFSVSHATDSGRDLFRILSDGSHLRRLTSTRDGSAHVATWEQPGWVLFDRQDGQTRTLSLLHLNGQQKALLEGNLPPLTNDYFRRYHDPAKAKLYLIISVAEQTHLWILDLSTGEREVVAMPVVPSHYVGFYEGGSYVFWSNAESAGDLYRFEFDSPPRVTRLTERGAIADRSVLMVRSGWIYFFKGSADPTGAVPLYRMRADGTDEQSVASEILRLQGMSTLLTSWNADTLYYWAGSMDSPYLVRTDMDGGNPTRLPIVAPLAGRLVGWSADGKWLYYRIPLGDETGYFVPSDLYRVNIETGESSLVLPAQTVLQTRWTPDYMWEVLLLEDEHEQRWLYKMRPDGSEFTSLGIEVRGYLYELNEIGLLVFEHVISSRTGDRDFGLHTLDLATFELRLLTDGQPASRTRRFEYGLPMPERDWQPAWLIGTAVVLFGVGVFPPRWTRQRFVVLLRRVRPAANTRPHSSDAPPASSGA